MIQTYTCALSLLEYGVASITLPHEQVSGDRHLVKTIHNGALLTVVDGSGHGKEAAAPARLAMESVETHANEGVVSLFRHCHEALEGTRGVVMSIAAIDAAQNMLTWAGVGNIEGIVFRAGSSPQGVSRLLVRPGIVGYRLPCVRAEVVPIVPGDLIILATDGISPDYENRIIPQEHPRTIAKKISSDYSKRYDDGLVLVARYLGHNE